MKRYTRKGRKRIEGNEVRQEGTELDKETQKKRDEEVDRARRERNGGLVGGQEKN